MTVKEESQDNEAKMVLIWFSFRCIKQEEDEAITRGERYRTLETFEHVSIQVAEIIRKSVLYCAT